MLSALRAQIKRQLLRRLRYDASVRLDSDALTAGVRRDVKWIHVQPDVDLELYWKVLPIGKGQAVSLYVFGFLILRFDCFGETYGLFTIILVWPSPYLDNSNWMYVQHASV